MRHPRSRRRGISMMMVTAFIAAASVIGLALISSTALQSAATRNQDLVAQADALAESGINQALYWVQNLSDSGKCPAAVASLAVGQSTTLTGRTVKGMPGSFDVTVTRMSATRYQLATAGNAPPPAAAARPGDPTVQRALTAQVDANYFGYAISATNLTSGLTIPPSVTVNGDIVSSAPVTVATGATVTGTVYDTTSTSGSGGLLGGLLATVGNTLNAVVATLVPTPATANHYPTYTYNGKTYAAQEITTATLANTTLGPTPANPAGVFFHAGALTLAGNVRINGTLVLKDTVNLLLLTDPGTLRIQNKSNVITQTAPDLPALVADGDITFAASNSSLEINGLTYTGGRINRASSAYVNDTLNITGTLLFGGTSASFDSTVPTRIAYDRPRASVPSLVTNAKPAPTSITIVYWKN